MKSFAKSSRTRPSEALRAGSLLKRISLKVSKAITEEKEIAFPRALTYSYSNDLAACSVGRTSLLPSSSRSNSFS